MVDLVGSSNNPVSGMAIATLILTAVIFKASDMNMKEALAGTIVVGSIICIIAAIAVAIEFLGIPSLPFAVGMYLPIHLSAGIMLGGIIRFIVDKAAAKMADRGILVASGMIAGEGLVGIILAIMEVI